MNWWSLKREETQVGEMAEKTVINAMKMCAVEGKHMTVRLTISLAICSVAQDVFDKGVIAGQMPKAALKAAVQPAMIIAVGDAFLKNDDFTDSVETLL